MTSPERRRNAHLRHIITTATAAATAEWESGPHTAAAPDVKVAIRIPRQQRDPENPFIEIYAVIKREEPKVGVGITHLAGSNPHQAYVVANSKCKLVTFQATSALPACRFYKIEETEQDYKISPYRSAIRPSACELPNTTIESYVAKRVAAAIIDAVREAMRD